MTQQQKEEIEKEFKEAHSWHNDAYSKEEYVDWWLSKFDQLIQEKMENIEKSRDNYSFAEPREVFDEVVAILKE